MSSIDTRVVEAKFKNDQFSAGVSDTMSLLDRLKSALHLDGAAKGLQDVSAAAKGFDSSGMEQGAGRIAGAFSSMQAISFGALASIGAKAVAIGGQLASSFTIAPMKAGFDEYELKMGSIQTILANTARYGTSLSTVNSSLDELNAYADQTIYNFGDMTKNIGLFTNAGIRVEDATSMIKGFSNAAAASGTSAEGASGAAYQLSQALSAGKVTLMDWRSLQNVGMGNKNMQSGIIDLASAMGTFTGTGTDATAATADFNGSLEKGWLKADVMSNYLKIMSGDMDAAGMAALGLSQDQIASFQAQEKTGLEAATKVRTFTQLMGTLKEAVGSGWTDTFSIIFGNFDEATTLFTSISNSVGGFVSRMSNARNSLLQGWKDLGGRDQLINGLTDAFWLLGTPLAKVGQAFREIFPKSTSQDLFNATKSFADLMAEIQPGPETLDRIQRTFAGLFAVLHIGWTIIKAVAQFLGNLFLSFTDGDSGVLRMTASIGDFLVGLDKAISSGQGLNSFFDKLFTILMKVINPIKDAGKSLGQMFEKLDFSGVGSGLGDFITKLLSFGGAADSSKSSFEKFTGFLDGLQHTFEKVYHAFGDFFSGIGKILNNPFGDVNYTDIMQGLEVGTLGAIGLFIAKLAKAIKGFSLFGGNSGPGGIMTSLKESMEQVTGTMKAMQNNLNATALLKLAAALAIMAVSIVLLASVDSAGLIRASIAMAVMFAELAGGMKLFNKAVGYGAAAKMNLLAPALILIAIAVGILALSVKALSDLSWEELAKGLIGLAAMMGILSVSVMLMSGNSKGMATTATGLLLISVAIGQLVDSVKGMAEMSWADLAKGLGGVAALLISLALFTKFSDANSAGVAAGAGILLISIAIGKLVDSMNKIAGSSWEDLSKGMAVIGASLLAMSLALNMIPASSILGAFAMVKIADALSIVADTFLKMQQLSWEELARGIGALAGSFGIVVLAMQAFQKVNFVKMAGILIVSLAIQILSDALMELSNLGWEEIGKGLTSLAGMMLILGVALQFMDGSIAGAVALVVVAAGLNVLLPVILAFSGLSWGEIAAGLTMLAGVFLILGAAGYLLAPVVPVLMGLGIAIALLGAAMLLAGAGVFLFATGLAVLAAAGAGATAAIVAIVSGLIGLLPLVAQEIGLALIAFAQVIATAGPAILAAITAVLLSLLQAIIDVTPKIGETLLTLLNTMLVVLQVAVPRLIQAGVNLLMALLNGIAQNIGQIVDKAAEIVRKFIDGISRNLPGIIDSAINLIVSFVNGLADGIRRHQQEMSDAGVNLAKAIVQGMVNGIGTGIKAVTDAAKNLAKGALDAAKNFLGINSPSKEFHKIGMGVNEGMRNGIDAYSYMSSDATERMGSSVLSTMGKTISGLGDLIGGLDEMNPTITPVLDLSSIQKDSSLIGDILQTTPLDLSSSTARAGDTSAGYAANQAAYADAVASAGTTLTFNQVNNSPKALSQVEIYRQTNNQLSQAKGALTNAN